MFGLALLTTACGPDFPARESAPLEPAAWSGTLPVDADPRSGVFLQVEESALGAIVAGPLARYTGTAVEAVTPDIPDSAEPVRTIRWFEDGAWIGVSPHHLEGDTWVAYGVTDCDPASGGAALFFEDARADDDVFATIDHVTLCHFDGAAWTHEALGFTSTGMVAVPGGLVAIDADDRVLRRADGAETWEVLDVGGVGGWIEASADGTATVGYFPEGGLEWLERSVDMAGVRARPTGAVVTPDGQTWVLEGTSAERVRCSNSLLTGRSCSETTDWVQWVLYRVEGENRVEVGHLDLTSIEHGSGIWVELEPVVPGGIAVVGNEVWIYP